MSVATAMQECRTDLRRLAEHAWDQEVRHAEIEAWLSNFTGQVLSIEREQLYLAFSLTRYMYFSKRLVREMLRSLYRDHFRAPLIQRLRRNAGGTRDFHVLSQLYDQELRATRFIGVGNPAESGAHLLYYFRQVNHLQKDLFADFHGAFQPIAAAAGVSYEPRDASITRYVFFDDLVASGSQVNQYLRQDLARIRSAVNPPDLRFLALFATGQGLERLNQPELFNGSAAALFELDDSYRACEPGARYFQNAPSWFDPQELRQVLSHYGEHLWPGNALGFRDGQLLLAFSHNSPDNAPPAYWNEGRDYPWSPVFMRFDKAY